MPYADIEKRREYSRNYRKANPAKMNSYVRVAKKKALMEQCGLTYDHYLQMVDDQDGMCAICGNTKTRKGKSLCIDHCHSTNTIRGLLCDDCNIMLGFARDNPARLRSAAAYLERYQNNG